MRSSQMATAELLKPDRYEAYSEGDFVVFDDVPLFDEHTGADGTKYDQRLLQHICDNMNFRVEDTGDYAAIASSHTNDEGKPQPQVLGFAGPYRLKKIGKLDPRWCIHGKCHVFKEHEKTFRDNPRRSVELWPEDKPENRYFDPIAVLGAESPRRALGLIYSKPTSPKVERYSMAGAASPGGANTCVPEFGKEKTEPERYDAADAPPTPGATGALSEDDIDRIVAAMKPVMKALIAEELGGDAIADEEQGEPVEPMDETKPAGEAEHMAQGDEPTDAPPEEQEEAEMPPEADAKTEKPEQYRKLHDEVERYRKENAQLKKDQTSLQEQYAKQNERIAVIETERRQVYRYSKLKEKNDEGFNFDLDEEVKETAELTDAQFEKHLKTVEKYSKVPLNRTLPIPPAERNPDRGKADQQAQQYAKKAEALVNDWRAKKLPGAFDDGVFARALAEVKGQNGAAAGAAA